MEGRSSDSNLRDSLMALPGWAALTAVGLLGAGIGAGVMLLLLPDLNAALRGAGGQLLLITLPVLALAVIALGASLASTERIDDMVATFVGKTMGDKFEAYLLPPAHGGARSYPFPPLFARMERHFSKEISSYCYYRFFDDQERRFDILVKSNVFNIEFTLTLQLATPPAGGSSATTHDSYRFDSPEAWSHASGNPLVKLAPGAIHGSLAEGYTIHVSAETEPGGGLLVVFRLRQKLQENFLTSPYLRRYFSEDAAIAAYFFYSEAFANGGDNIRGGKWASDAELAS